MTVSMFDHLLSMSDDIGLFEHAELAVARPEHGYCTDDMARLLVVISRESEPDRPVRELARTAIKFLAGAQRVDGKIRNRRSARGRWSGGHSVDDCWGRSLWAFGTAARLAPEEWMRQSCLAYFGHGIQQRSPSPRAMAFAALGAVDVATAHPTHRGARLLLNDAVTTIGRPASNRDWPWPEERLAYANAALAEALMAAGDLLGRPEVTGDGITMLRWLLDRETVGSHLSPTPVDGAGPADTPPAFDQQPIEVAAMADACHRAYLVTDDAEWLRGIEMAAEWFAGDNDAGIAMWDSETGGGYDGLHTSGPNMNQGAESTLALVSVRQHARHLVTTNGHARASSLFA
ncbi:MAG: hypothetical protein RIE08_10950 [Acidimicrobiales bacterium]